MLSPVVWDRQCKRFTSLQNRKTVRTLGNTNRQTQRLWHHHHHPPFGQSTSTWGDISSADKILPGVENAKDLRLCTPCPRTLNPALRPLCDIPSGCCSFTGPWAVTRSSLRMLRPAAAFCRPLWPVLLLVLFPRSRSPVVGVLGLCWMWHGVPFARQRRPIIGVLRMCWLLAGSFDCFCCPRASVHRPSVACLAVFL